MRQESTSAMAPALVEVLRRDLPELFEQAIRAEATGDNRVLLSTGLRGQRLIVCKDPNNFELADLDFASRPGPSTLCDKKALGTEIVAWADRNGANA